MDILLFIILNNKIFVNLQKLKLLIISKLLSKNKMKIKIRIKINLNNQVKMNKIKV